MICRRIVFGLWLLGLFPGFALAEGLSTEVTDEIFLLVREREVLAFSAVQDVWVTQQLRPNEQVLDNKYSGHVAIVFTNFRILGFSALRNKWTEEDLMVGESMVRLEASGNVGAVVTNRRALGFGARTGKWTTERFGPR